MREGYEIVYVEDLNELGQIYSLLWLEFRYELMYHLASVVQIISLTDLSLDLIELMQCLLEPL